MITTANESTHRNFELCGLQAQHIKRDCKGPPPYEHDHFKVHLENRKGWQQKQGWDGPLESEHVHLRDGKWSSSLF